MGQKHGNLNCVYIFPQTGLALMGFSWYCPRSLDLNNFVVWSCRGSAAELSPAVRQLGPSRAQAGQAGPKPDPSWAQAGPQLGPSQISGNLEIWDLEIWDPKKFKKLKLSRSKSVLPKMSARSGLVGKNPPGPIWGHLGQFFAWARKIKEF